MIHFKPFNEPYEFLFLNKPHGKSISFKSGETIKAEVMDVMPNGAVFVRIKDTTAMIKTEIPLQKDTTLLLRVMDSANSDKKIKLQLLEQFKPSKDIASSIKNLDFKQNRELLIELIKNYPNKIDILKSWVDSGLTKELQDINKNIKNLFLTFKQKSTIENFLNIKDLDYRKLENIIKNSGVFFESKLKSKKDLSNDLKSILLDLQESTKDKKIKQEISHALNQIESYQFLSEIIDGVYTFLPIFWDSLDRGEIAIKRGENRGYLCRISLDFQDLGEVDATVFLYENDIKIDLFVENQEFKKEIRKNIDFLKSQLKEDGFANIFINFVKRDDEYLEKIANFKSIVDVKV